MPEYFLTRKAEGDMASIWEFTARCWSKGQARKYLTQLEKRFAALARCPKQARKRYELFGKPYSFHEGRHVIFYHEIKEGIEIIRVLHDQMDVSRHLQ